MAQIFISYRRADSQAITDRIYERLVDAFGRGEVFKDVDDIPLGTHFPTHLEEVIQDASFVLVIIGQEWATTTGADGQPRLHDPQDFVRLEVEAALNLPDAVVIPVLVNGAQMPAPSQLPPTLQPLLSLNATSIGNDPAFADDVARLIRNLRELGVKARVEGTSWQRLIFSGLLVLVALAAIVMGFSSTLRNTVEPTPVPTTEPTAAPSQQVRVTVTFTSVTIHEDAEVGSPGDLWLDFNVNGSTRRYPSGDDTVNVTNGDVLDLNTTINVTLNRDQDLTVFVNGTEWDAGISGENDDMGVVNRRFTAADNWGAGSHSTRSTCPRGCYTIHYTITVTPL